MPLTLAQFTQRQLDSQGLTVKEFARRGGLGLSHAYQILRGERPRSSIDTVDAVAKGLSMTSAELLRALESDVEEDPIEQAIRQRTAEMREAVRDTPPEFWGTIIKSTFDRAIDGARDMAQILAEGSNAHQGGTKSRRGTGPKRRSTDLDTPPDAFGEPLTKSFVRVMGLQTASCSS